MKDFELNPLQRAMRLWVTLYLADLRDKNDYYIYESLSRREIISKKVDTLNHHIGNLLFNKGGQYGSLNIHYNDLLSGPHSLFDICAIKNHQQSLVDVNKLSLGLFNRNNSMNLIPPITINFKRLQNVLSKKIQHLQIYIDTKREHSELSRDLINFIQSQRQLKSLSANVFWKADETRSFLHALQKHSTSLTFLRIEDEYSPILSNQLLLSILNLLPNLVTLELPMISNEKVSPNLSVPPRCFFNLEHLHYYENLFINNGKPDRIRPIPIALYKQILLSTSNNLKSLKIQYIYCSLIKEIQEEGLLNITHFHIEADRTSCPSWLMSLLNNLNKLVHFKLTMLISCSEYFDNDFVHVLNNIKTFEKFSRALSSSLETLEVNFPIVEECLKVLLSESKCKLRHIRFYNDCYHNLDSFLKYPDNFLRILIDYAQGGSLREVGIAIRYTFSKRYIEEAQRYFSIVMLNGYEIDNPFYSKFVKTIIFNI
ncbi:5845_t:CDS:1 [Funneliformis geosporum]|nr:5845_t:CDS:1 [Funneliformis geosporum]